jgi:outer membrane protein TolC
MNLAWSIFALASLGPAEQAVWPMTVREAIAIALERSEFARVTFRGDQNTALEGFEPPPKRPHAEAPKGIGADSLSIVIARRDADASIWQFKADAMALVRSVEEQYWRLVQAQVALWSADRAVGSAQEVLQTEESDHTPSRAGNSANIAEAGNGLKQFKREMAMRTADVVTAERQLRNTLGLPPVDNRRIIPITPPSESQIVFDWASCTQEMIEQQPDVVQLRLFGRLAELQLILVRNQCLPRLSSTTFRQLASLGRQLDSSPVIKATPLGQMLKATIAQSERCAGLERDPSVDESLTFRQVLIPYIEFGSGRALPNTRASQYMLVRARGSEWAVHRQATDSLERSFAAVNAGFSAYHADSIRSAASKLRLESKRAYYDEGRVTADRLLDAVHEYSTAVTAEHQCLANYNISLAALCQAKGTLLTDHNIVMADVPDPQPARRPVAKPWEMPGSHRRREGILGGLGCDSSTFAPIGRAVKSNQEHRPGGCPFGVEDMDGTALFGKEARKS